MAADTNTPRPNLTKQGQCGHCCSERDCCSQGKVEASNQASLLPEASSRPQLLPRMHLGCWIWRSRSTGPDSTARTHVTDVCSIFARPQLTEVMHSIQEASWIFPTDYSWIWIVPLLSGIAVAALGRAVTGQLLAEMVKPHIWHGRTSWECARSLSSMSLCEDCHTEWCATAASLQTAHMFK